MPFRHFARLTYGNMRAPATTINYAVSISGVTLLVFYLSTTHVRPISSRYALNADRNVVPIAFESRDVDNLLHAMDCGSTCQYDPAAKSPSVSQVVPIQIDCPKTFLRLLGKCPALEPPPRRIPNETYADFTMNGALNVFDYYVYHRYSGAKALMSTWSKKEIDEALKADALFPAAEKWLSYSRAEGVYVEDAVHEFRSAIRNGVGIVWGSEKPWLEVILMRGGAKHIVTVEYGDVVSEHPAMTVVNPAQFAAFMLTNPRAFDFAVTFSSLEHSGLGRYGDAVDAFGDLQAAAETWCALKPGGLFLLGLPSTDEHALRDELHWTAHRYYGRRRLAQMFRGFRYIKSLNVTKTGANPRVSIFHVLQKPHG
jgi:hypothetical protein